MASLEATNELKDEDRNSLSPRPKTRSLSVTHVLLEVIYAPDEVWGRDKDTCRMRSGDETKTVMNVVHFLPHACG